MKTNKQTWKQVSISGVTGILMGAGAMKAMQHKVVDEVVNEAEQAPTETSYDDMSFREAFDAARAEQGPGGVFRWHGNIYNTYTAEEWNAKTAEDQNTFAEQVGAEVSAEDVDTSSFAQAEAGVQSEEGNADVSVAQDNSSTATTSAASEQTTTDSDDDVRVVGFGEVQLENGRNVTVQELDINGQRVAVVDLDQDGTPDIALSDVNHNQKMDEGEVIDLHTGEALSFTNDEVASSDLPIDTLDA